MHSIPKPPKLSESDSQIFDNNVSTLRLYQVWKGRNKFCFGGRMILGPDVRSIFLTLFLILTPVILFCGFVSQSLMKEFNHDFGRLIFIICIAFSLYVVVLLFLTSGRDPGIIPRNSHPPEIDEDGSTIATDWLGSQNWVRTIPPTRDVIVNGMIVKVKYCQTCMLYRPPRCSHCSICSNCVERFDHHCPWVGQCIGKRNYRFFFMFVSSTTMLCIYVFTFCWVNISQIMHKHHTSLWKALVKSPVSGILILYTFVTVWFVGGLTAFHLYLIITNQTTYENFRYRYHRKMNPYNRGCLRNIVEIFFSKIPSSKNNFRAKVKVDSSAIFAMSMGPSRSSEVPKRTSNVDMEKRRAVAAEDLEDIQSQLDSVSGLQRCRTQPMHASWDLRNDWENTSNMQILAAEFGMEHGVSDKKLMAIDKVGL